MIGVCVCVCVCVYSKWRLSTMPPHGSSYMILSGFCTTASSTMEVGALSITVCVCVCVCVRAGVITVPLLS